MAEVSDEYGILRQNLIDAGYSENEAEVCLDYARKNEWKKLISALTEYKKTLLEQVHTSEKQIDCLDFLIYRLNREVFR